MYVPTSKLAKEPLLTKNQAQVAVPIVIAKNVEPLHDTDPCTSRNSNRAVAPSSSSENSSCCRNFGGRHRRSIYCYGLTMLCILCVNGFLSMLCVNGAFSILSINSILSVGCINSVLSFRSVNSFFSVNCHNGFMSHCS